MIKTFARDFHKTSALQKSSNPRRLTHTHTHLRSSVCKCGCLGVLETSAPIRRMSMGGKESRRSIPGDPSHLARYYGATESAWNNGGAGQPENPLRNASKTLLTGDRSEATLRGTHHQRQDPRHVVVAIEGFKTSAYQPPNVLKAIHTPGGPTRAQGKRTDLVTTGDQVEQRTAAECRRCATKSKGTSSGICRGQVSHSGQPLANKFYSLLHHCFDN